MRLYRSCAQNSNGFPFHLEQKSIFKWPKDPTGSASPFDLICGFPCMHSALASLVPCCSSTLQAHSCLGLLFAWIDPVSSLWKAIHANLLVFLLRTLLSFPVIKALLGDPAHTGERKENQYCLRNAFIRYIIYTIQGPLPLETMTYKIKSNFTSQEKERNTKYMKRCWTSFD